LISAHSVSLGLKVVVDDGAQHNQAAWSRRLPDALLFLYGTWQLAFRSWLGGLTKD
jgi:hypothetical protein